MNDFPRPNTRGWLQLVRSGLAAMLLAPAVALAQVVVTPAKILSIILPLLLGGQPSTTTLAAAPASSAFGQNVQLTATVAGSGPTGTVTFYSGSTTLGAARISGGVAVLNTATLSTGASSLSAGYGGDTRNEPSTSGAITQTVTPAASTLLLAATPNPSLFTQGVTLTATVVGFNPSGTVSFRDAAVLLGTASLVNGTARLGTSALAPGQRSLRAEYAGDPNHASSVSSVLSQTVNQASLSVSPASAVQGQTVTLVLAVAGANPTGAVTFKEGETALGSATVANGQATFSTSSLGVGPHTVTASYGGDANNVAAQSGPANVYIVGASSTVWQFGYDTMGRLNTEVPPHGEASYFYHDRLGRRIQSSEPPNNGTATRTITEFAYDPGDSLTRVTDPRSVATTYVGTGLGEVKQSLSKDSGETRYTYDARGNVASSVDARNKETTYAYDALGRLVTMTHAAATTTSFVYDGGPGAAPSGSTGQLTGITDESGSTSYQHDAFSRVTRKLATIGGRTFKVEYGWGNVGGARDKLTSITYPGGSRVNYGYDSFGLLKSISVNPANPNGSGFNATPGLLVTDITFDAEGKVVGWKWSDGKPRPIGYDGDGEVASYTLGDPQGAGNKAGVLRTVRRSGGRIVGFTHTGTGAAGLEQAFEYDKLDRLTVATLNGSGTIYGYDATGNRTSRTVGGTPYVTMIEPTSNRLVSVEEAGATATISHDAAGNVLTDGSNTFAYSDRGRMASATPPAGAGTVSYLYNGLNQRARKSGPPGLVGTGTMHYVYDESGQLLGEYDANGTPLYETIYLGSTPVGLLKQAGTTAGNNIAVTLHNAYADHIDTVRAVTRQDHTMVWRWDTAEPFGASVPNENPSGLGAFVFNQRFPGQVFDAETGLSQNWHREYNSRWGRYVEPDPIGLAGGINTFAYVGSQPLRFTDRRGLWATDAHDYFIDKMFRDLPSGIRDIIKEGSAFTDRPGYQTSKYSHMHAMSSEAMNPEEARRKMCEFIKDSMGKARDAQSDGTAHYWFYLGMALHPVMDSTSPAHEGFQKWRNREASKHGNMPRSLEDLDVARNPYHTSRTLQRMREAMAGDLRGCGC